ncbi:PIN domain-containing protein [Curtobacterium pusillum]|uniref:PIN domain-containing protein n=1 Tax=Curtobacterium pusillum TaxID=69373 RepID=UPI00119F9024|nr:PIN domain-containing protein [Curtobacterium pusillum]
MRDEFRGFYPPTPGELDLLWGGEIVLDANVLLNLYRYRPATVSNLLTVLGRLQTQIWLPHQAAAEFHRNRLAVMSAQPKAYDDLTRAITEGRGKLLAAIRSKSRHPEIDAKRLEEITNDSLDAIEMELSSQLQESTPPSPADLAMDPILEQITKIFADRVGKAFENEDLTRLYSQADDRFAKSIPPGYRDVKKEGDNKYGDFVIWSEILKRGRENQRPVIFITDDLKEDWWQRFSGHTLGPQPALVQEFLSETNQLFYIYDPRQFIDEASRRLSVPLDASTLGEVGQVSREGDLIDQIDELDRIESELEMRRAVRAEQSEQAIRHAQHVLDLERKKRSLDKTVSSLHSRLFENGGNDFDSRLGSDLDRLSLFEQQSDLEIAMIESNRLRGEIERVKGSRYRLHLSDEETAAIDRQLAEVRARRAEIERHLR